jgi:hypothetical protein
VCNQTHPQRQPDSNQAVEPYSPVRPGSCLILSQYHLKQGLNIIFVENLSLNRITRLPKFKDNNWAGQNKHQPVIMKTLKNERG